MNRWIFATAASVALVGAGLVHGYWTDRWAPSTRVNEAADRFADVPVRCGDVWEGEDVAVKPGQVGAGVVGSLQRRYVNKATGDAVVIALVNGRPGPVATHTPEVCYGASGYAVGEKQSVSLDSNGLSSQFWTSVAARRRGPEETRLRLYWAWNGGDGWKASSDARSQFSRFRYPVLHKLYVLRDLSGMGQPRPLGDGADAAGSPGRDPVCEAFLAAFLPELDRTLFAHNN